jgi:integrase
MIKALRQVYKFAIEYGHAAKNPAAAVPYLFTKEGGFHAWTIEEVAQFENWFPIRSKARLAFALLLYTGQRRSDIVRFGKRHVKDGWLKFTQEKNRLRRPVTLELPIVPALQHILDVSPTGDVTFLVTEHGKPFSGNGFGNRFRAWCDEAGLPQCSAHGLRKAAASRLAELGCSELEIMSVTGHQTMKEVERYTKSARQKVLAGSAMAKLRDGQN